VLCHRCWGCGPAELVCSLVHCLSVSIQMSETCRGHLWDKIIVKLFASSWYIFLTSIRESFDKLPLENSKRDWRITLRWHLNSESLLTLFTGTVITDAGYPNSPFVFIVLKVCNKITLNYNTLSILKPRLLYSKQSFYFTTTPVQEFKTSII